MQGTIQQKKVIKNVPKLRFPGFSDPWQEKRLGKIIANYRLGGNYTNSEIKTKRPLIKMGNIGRGSIILNKIEYIPEDSKIDEDDKIKKDDLFFNTRNTLDLVGKVSIWRDELPMAYYNSNLMCLRFECNKFMNYYLNSQNGLRALRAIATGTTSVAAIYTRDFLRVKLNVPDLSEQKKIAGFLSEVDGWIENLRQQKDQLEQYKKGMMQKIFSQKIRFKDDNGKDFPDWEGKKMSDIAELSTAPYSETDDNLQEGYYLIDMGAVSSDGKLLVSKRTKSKNNLLKSGTLVMPNRDIGKGDIIGKVAMIEDDDKFVLGNNMYRLLLKNEALPRFVFYLINSPKANKEMRRRANGTSQLQLIRKDIETVRFLLPSKGEQQKIANFLTSIDKIIESKQQQITQAEEWKKGLMQGLFV